LGKRSPGVHPECAANLAVTRVPMVSQNLSAADARVQLRTVNFDVVEVILVVDDDGRFAGAAQLKDVLQAPDETPLSSLAHKTWPVVRPDTDQEYAADLAHQHKVTAIPVLAADGKPLGLIPALALLEILAQEHHEDVHRLVGILKMRAGARHALDDPPLMRAGRRLPWLLVGLMLSTVVTAMMVGFEHALSANIAIAFFIPALVYLADAVGTQTEAVVVRGLSLRMRPLLPLLVGEAATGALIGLSLAFLAFLGIWFVFQDLRLAIGVALALFAASTIASVLGLLLPWLLARFGTDPAFGSGPVATIIQDVLTIAIYFAVMATVIDL
jgi:magnesium transporter